MKNIPFGKPIIDLKITSKIKQILNSGQLVHGVYQKNFEDIFKKQNTNASNMRVYEIMGSRNFLISEYSSLLDDIFVEGKEIEFFREPIELYEKVNFYLKRDDLREKISMNGYYKIKNENYEHRVNEIKKIYDEIRKNY